MLAGTGAVAAVGATSVMAAAAATTTIPARDGTIVVPAVTGATPATAAGAGTGSVAIEAPASEEVRRQGASNRTTWIVVALVVALALVGVLAYRGLSGASTITIPTVVGHDVTTERTTLENLGLKVATQSKAVNSPAAQTVISSTPTEGTAVAPGSLVTLVYAVQPVLVPVPTVTGQLLQDAITALHAAHLNYKTTSVASWTRAVAPGTVLQQSATAGTMIASGSTVTLTLLQSGGTFPMPTVIDSPALAAATTLGQYGLNATTQRSACSNSTSADLVAQTVPAPGTSVSAGTAVTLTISTGPCPVKVPNVQTLTLAQATSSLSSVGLHAVPSTSCPPGDVTTTTVTSQNPVFGTSVPPGSPVQLTFCGPQGNSGTTG